MEYVVEDHSEESDNDNDNADDLEIQAQTEDTSKFILNFMYVILNI